MSRDPTLILDESNLVIGKDGRVHYTFTAEDDNPKVRLASKCLGTAHFNQLMIERGDQATSYVAPVVVEGTGNPTGLFKDLKEISLELTDIENSKLWSKIKVNNRGMLQEYYDGTIKTEIINSAQGVATRISEDTGKKLALINDTINGIRREYQNADKKLSASYQASIDGLKATMANDKIGLQAEIKASAQGLSQKYDDELRKLSAKITTTSSGTTEAYENKLNGLRAEFTRSNQGMRTELESKISGLRTVQQTTANQISQEIRNREGAVSRVQQDLASYQRRLQDAEDNYSSLTHTIRGLQSDVGSPTGKIQSRLTQLAGQIEQRVTRDGVMSIISGAGDSIKLAIQKAGGINAKMSGNEIISAINLNSYGVTIAGKHIALDGNTTV
ncbi:TPA: hyaluronidase, partial [Streptococcus pyogenes]|nr:hyaluronidase [Streptococcus pyogenes]